MTKEELLKNFKILAVKKIGKATIITTEDKKYVIKPSSRKADFYDYLVTRNFNYFPVIYTKVGDEVELSDYIEEKNVPIEQKLEDITYLASILHGKTSFDKVLDIDFIKELYENTIDKQNSLLKYYQELQNIIEQEIYMSPANYYLIRNMTLVYIALKKSRKYLDDWYNEVEKEKSVRYSYIHGNLSESHLIENDGLYLISWDLSRIDFPIIDLEKFYRNSYKNISLKDMLAIYESKYPLKKEEKNLLFALILIPDKINFVQDEYPKIKEVSNLVLYLENTLKSLEDYSNKTNNNTSK